MKHNDKQVHKPSQEQIQYKVVNQRSMNDSQIAQLLYVGLVFWGDEGIFPQYGRLLQRLTRLRIPTEELNKQFFQTLRMGIISITKILVVDNELSIQFLQHCSFKILKQFIGWSQQNGKGFQQVKRCAIQMIELLKLYSTLRTHSATAQNLAYRTITSVSEFRLIIENIKLTFNLQKIYDLSFKKTEDLIYVNNRFMKHDIEYYKNSTIFKIFQIQAEQVVVHSPAHIRKLCEISGNNDLYQLGYEAGVSENVRNNQIEQVYNQDCIDIVSHKKVRI